MFTFLRLGSISFLIGISLMASAQEPVDTKALSKEAVKLVKQLGGQLKPQLKSAIESGGFEKAVKVCSEKAPAIAAELSKSSGWNVKRISLKPRNDKTAIADAYEVEVLKQFENRLAAGEDAEKLSSSAVEDGQFRFLKAQAIEGLCLNCHGENINEKVKQVISNHYPNDMATGYKLGQIRGAFSLTKAL